MRWQEGRSGGGYQKMTLVDSHWPIRWDMHLMRTDAGSCVMPHRDPIPGMDHWRINLVLRMPRRGGEFVSEESIIDRPRLKLFRPDLCTHLVTQVEEGTRVCLSIGWALKKRKE